jgi:DNA (cytosine-5)-methyltransferase 1
VNELALFAGAGGGILGGHLLGWRTVCAVEWEPYPASVLCARQNDGLLPPFPIWDDVQTFDGRPWRGIVDVVSGGFPCQDISAAGKGVGIEGERSGMWREMARIIREVRPRFVFVENSPMLTTRGLGVVLGELAAMGFDAKWGVLGAADIGANHQRDRIWIRAKWRGLLPHAQHDRIRWWEQQQESIEKEGRDVANSSSQRGQAGFTDSQGWQERDSNLTFNSSSNLAYTENERDVWREWELGFVEQKHNSRRGSTNGSRKWWSAEPNVGRVVDGVAARVDRLKAIGNGQVPLCAATAWKLLSERI